MRKVFAWRIAGVVTAVLGFMVFGGLLALLFLRVPVSTTAVGVGAITSGTLVMAALTLLLGSVLLECSYGQPALHHVAEVTQDLAEAKRDLAEVKQEIAEVKQALASLTDQMSSIAGTITSRCNDLNGISRLARRTAKRMGAAERQLAAARSAEGTLARAQAALDRRSAESREQLSGSVHRIH